MGEHHRRGEAPITEVDAFIAKALDSASIPTLMMSMAHITGAPSLLDGAIRPHDCVLNDYQGSMTEEERANIRAQALKVLADYRDGGCSFPPPPSPETIHAMMSYMVAEEVPDEYVPMMLEEMALEADDGCDVRWGASDRRRTGGAFRSS